MIQYRENNAISADALIALYNSVGWSGYTDHPEKMARLLDGSLWYLSAYHEERLVGLIRAVGDDCSIAYIQDILVDPAYQRQGIGTALIQAALARFASIRQIVLLTDDTAQTSAFYESMGMQRATDLNCLCYVRYNAAV